MFISYQNTREIIQARGLNYQMFTISSVFASSRFAN